MDFKDEQKAYNREKIIRIIEDGMKSEYWKVLKGEVERHLESYDNYLTRLDSKRLSEKDLNERNEIIFQRKFMKWFLGINEKILKDQESWFNKMGRGLETVYNRVETFVKR